MGYNMKRGAAPKFKELGSSPAKDVDMSKLRSKQARMSKGISEFEHFTNPNTQGDEPGVEGTRGGGTQTTGFSGKKITPTSKHGPNMHKGHGDEDLRGKLEKGSAPQHKYHLKENLTQEERARLLKDPDYKKSPAKEKLKQLNPYKEKTFMAVHKPLRKEKGFMQPPYKDTVEGTRPYEKRQAYHGFKVQPNIPVKPKDKEMKKFSDLEKYDDDKS